MTVPNIVSKEIRDSLLIQYGKEVYNSHFYLFLSAYLTNKGLDKLSKIFMDQYEEEKSHSLMIFKFLTDLNQIIIIPEIEEVDIAINSIIDIGEMFVNREIETTDSLNSIKLLAIEQGDCLSEEFIRGMLVKQIAEMEESYTFNDNAILCGSNWFNAKIWSDSL